jgi:two-component system, NtrC family, nitrogen regulation sensor histidine kinase NtrY
MDAVTEPLTETAPPRRRFGVTPALEVGVLVLAVAIGIISYFVIRGEDSPERLLTPPLVAALLVANLLPGVALLVLIGRRVARRRAAKSAIGGEGRLHVRLVAIFSVLASVPTLFVTLIASLLFQYGVEFWFSDRARGMIENAQALAQQSYQQLLSYVDSNTVAMAVDLGNQLQETAPDSIQFSRVFAGQVYVRSLSEAIIFSVSRDGQIQSLALVNPYERDLAKEIDRAALAQLDRGAVSVVDAKGDRTRSFTRIPGTSDLYLYAGRASNLGQMSAATERAAQVLADYRALVSRSRSLQLQFNIALLALSLLVVGIAVWVALQVADRLVRPVNELVGAAREVAGGDLAARVPERMARDEIGVLAGAFNQMTSRLQQQTNALVTANAQIESRRALIEAVMSGVSAGVISIAADRTVRLMNQSARAQLRRDEDSIGKALRDIAPELDAVLDGVDRDAIVQLTSGGEARTLAVRITRDEGGQVLTFDDITQQLNDQRRAAWSDVARRIAHEIKNPLTPIQLAAERLQRRYGKQVDAEDGVFARLTETIVRQVGDLRRMVDEFSSFARMPKPVFRQESLLDLARQALFLHEVAHPTVRFTLEAPEDSPSLICDRRQIGQALTNVVKNAVEAIEARGEGEALPPGEVLLAIAPAENGRIVLTVTDNGIGLPVERDRIVEPYMTTRSRGTGLGLAIVKKIVEEHFGTITFGDRPGGGTVVTLCFDTDLLANMPAETDALAADEPRPAMLTRTGNNSS